jgi:membrane-associated phospholipid phosphatase
VIPPEPSGLGADFLMEQACAQDQQGSSFPVMRELGLLGRRLLLPAALLVGIMVLLGWLVSDVLAQSWLAATDADLNQEFVEERTSDLNTVSFLLSSLAATPVIIGLTLVTAATARLVWKRWHEAIYVVYAVVGEVVIFLATTLLIDRQRPSVPQLDAAPPTSSFPSGHTAAAVCFYGAAAAILAWRVRKRWVRWTVIALAVAIPLLVGIARLYRGMHFPTDVTGGLVLGLAWFAVVTRLVLLAPIAAAGDFVQGARKKAQETIRR